MSCVTHSNLCKSVIYSLFPVSNSYDSHFVIFKVAFVVYGHIECENGQFGAVWDGLWHALQSVEAS